MRLAQDRLVRLELLGLQVGEKLESDTMKTGLA
jgi:hypothetical protein